MSGPDQSVIHSRISEEISRLVADSIESRSCLRAGQHAATIARAYPNCGRSPDGIADQIIEAAIRARGVVEMSRPAGWRAAS